MESAKFMDTTNESLEVPGEIVPLTPEQQAEFDAYNAPEAVYARELEEVSVNRRLAYTAESDPLAFKYQETELPEDKALWLAKKAEIQGRYPEPVAPKAKKK
jgi:hypothetical protein